MTDLHQILCMLPVAMAQSSSGVVGGVLYCTSGFMDDVVYVHSEPVA